MSQEVPQYLRRDDMKHHKGNIPPLWPVERVRVLNGFVQASSYVGHGMVIEAIRIDDEWTAIKRDLQEVTDEESFDLIGEWLNE